MGKDRALQRFDLCLRRHRPCPDKGDLPHVDLTVGNHIGPRRCQMPAHPRADTINRLAHINRVAVQIAQRIDADLIGQRRQCLAPKRLRRVHATAPSD